MVSRSVAGSSRSAFLEQAFYRVSVPASRRIPRSLFTSRFVKMKKAEPCASSGGESLFYTVAPALHSAEAGPLQEMDKDLPAGRVKIDRPVVPFRGKFIGCPYRSLLCPTLLRNLAENSTNGTRPAPPGEFHRFEEIFQLWLSRSAAGLRVSLWRKYTETERCAMGSSHLFGLVIYIFRNYIRKEIYSSFFF